MPRSAKRNGRNGGEGGAGRDRPAAPCPGKDPEAVGKPDPLIVGPASRLFEEGGTDARLLGPVASTSRTTDYWKTTSARPPLPAIMLSKAAGMPSRAMCSVTIIDRSKRPARMWSARTGRSRAGSLLP